MNLTVIFAILVILAFIGLGAGIIVVFLRLKEKMLDELKDAGLTAK